MAAPTAIRVDDDLAAGQPAVALWTACHEPAGRIHVILDLPVDQCRGNSGSTISPDHVIADRRLGYVGRMLRGDDDRVDPHRPISFVLHRHLALAVRAQPVDFAAFAGFGQAVQDAMGEPDRQRHQFGSFVAGEAEHQPLVARSDVLARLVLLASTPWAMSGLCRSIDSITAQVSAQMPHSSSV